MKPHSSKLKHQEQNQHTEQQAHVEQQAAREFETVEELIRFDAAEVTPPPGVVERISRTVECDVRPARPWWKRFFGRP